MKTYFKGNHLKHFYCFLPDNSISSVFQITRLLHHSFTQLFLVNWDRKEGEGHDEEQVEHELDPSIDTLNGRSFTNLTPLTRHRGSNWPSQLDHCSSFSSFFSSSFYLNPVHSSSFVSRYHFARLFFSHLLKYGRIVLPELLPSTKRSRITFMTREKRRAWLFFLPHFLLLLRTVIGNGCKLYKFLARRILPWNSWFLK